MVGKLQEFTFDIEPRPGTLHGNADGLSRMYENDDLSATPDTLRVLTVQRQQSHMTASPNETSTTGYSSPEHLTVDWPTAQANDPDIGPIYKAMKSSNLPPRKEEMDACSGATKHLLNISPMLILRDNILYRRFVDIKGNIKHLQLIIPHAYQKDYIQQCHTGITGGHLGFKKTSLQLQRRAYFQGWRNMVRRFCNQCIAFAQYHRGKLTRQGCMQQMLVGKPFERVGIDLCGPFPLSHDNKQYILTMTDCFSKWTEAIAIQDKRASTIAQELINTWICHFGCPLQIFIRSRTRI